MRFVDIAAICHEANRALCMTDGDFSQLDWIRAPEWQRQSAVKGVIFCSLNPTAPASANHEAWLVDKIANGWVHGPVKDEAQKTHPCIVPYEQLPPQQQAKDHLFKAICGALLPFVKETT